MVPAFNHLIRSSANDSEIYRFQQQSWPACAEGDHSSQWRLRLVFTAAVEADVLGLFSHLPIAAVACLQRQQPLLGVELLLTAAPAAPQLDALRQIVALEWLLLQPTDVLPVLTTPGLLVMDMDSTAIQIECIDELAAAAGVGAEVAAVTERAMQGELDFEQSLRARVAKLKGADTAIIAQLCERLPLSPGLASMIAELQQYGWRTAVASGGFTPFVNHLKQLLALDAAYANELVLQDGKFMGEVTGKVVDAEFKAAVVTECAARWQIADGQKVAIGDGANDIPMISRADFGLAYHAKPKLAAVADANIYHLGLQVLPFFLQARG
ncbi:phosphoserine phosphatase SerB [Shewanella dokdonensis]|uniref:Phosphoserine phosphatase n=1 Tax=Shewanella dokdonensis TaxID=712036 RepID=A0ABX8DJC7_9GAMM|nr:phosphoserine phosphatase SerB [Shewanella dokdonensis]MCL1074184.1 phosphoserine phosphatase SerB [Shewanella dokdonensis]QVK23902.1 phosphoserine phosphatase SerB [Shewanella dokdonensis]